jgi:dCTP deaminase
VILSHQSIAARCQGERPLITPFRPEKVVINGKSAGLSSASYDCAIDHDLILGVHPGILIGRWLVRQDFRSLRGWWRAARALPTLVEELRAEPPHTSLAYTVEDFWMPADLSGAVCDKSSYARVFVSAMNTFFDPGFHGNATLELINEGTRRVYYKQGDPVCQFIFSLLDEPTDSPYVGKYQHQTKAAHAARYELPDGSWKPTASPPAPAADLPAASSFWS